MAAIVAASATAAAAFVVTPGSYPPTELHESYDFDGDGKNDLT